MVCSTCGRSIKPGARFCGGCGKSTAPLCPACGAECDTDARFCEACGVSLPASSADARVARKIVTIVFADLIGSTALHEHLDPESVRHIMEGYHRSVRTPIEAHGGTVVQLLGDGVMCAFGIPRVTEDDALRAVRAAVEVQRSFREFLHSHSELGERVGLRVAVNTGEVVVSDDYAAGIGDPLNVAARLQQEAKDGDVLIGEATHRLVSEQVTLLRVDRFTLKGRDEPVTAYRVVSLDRPAAIAATPFVGREDELRRLTAVYDAAIAAPAVHLAVLLGSPGLGKSRLLGEFEQRLGDRARVLTAHCSAAGGATFAPLGDALRALLTLEAGASGEALRAALAALLQGDDADRERIASGVDALLAGTPTSPEETFFAIRRLLTALAATRPVVLVLDDLQWAEPLLLDFIEHLVQWGAGVPLFVLAAARLDLRTARSSLTTRGGPVSEVVTLVGLDAGAATRLAASVIGADELPAAVAGRVLTASEGNPLFLGELIRMLVNDGALRRECDRWTLAVDLADLEMPPTIHALLAARIERLRPEEQLVLERASVIGRQFSRAAVTHLLPPEAQVDLDARLEALRRSELIETDPGWLLGDPALRFHHVLIRDAAYRRVLRGTRAELHASFADWLEGRAGESTAHEETVGWHLEQAHLHLRELGPLDANGRDLGERAAHKLAPAGRRALARDDLQPAASLLGRALACLASDDPARADLALDWSEALLAAGDVAPATQAIAELGRFAAGSERLGAWHTCFQGQLAVLSDPQALRTSASAVAAAAELLASVGDLAGEAKAHAVHADALARLGMIGACEAALDKALSAARKAGDRRRANAVLAGAPVAALWGPSPVTRASGRCLDVVRVLRITQGAPAVESVALRCQAVLETLRGRSEAAQRMIASARRLVEELGISQQLLEVDLFAGLIALYEGDSVAAEAWLRSAYDGFRAHGLGVDAARAAALLGRALLAQDQAAEAEALSHESEALAGDDFKAAIAWRGVRAEALLARDEHAAAIEFAGAAAEIAAATDDLLDHADARRALAVTLRAAGRGDDADAEQARAIELWEQKGATLLAEHARPTESRGAKAELEASVPGSRSQPEQRAEARARLDARTSAPATASSVSRRVSQNSATAHAAQVDAAIAARDADAIPALFADAMAAEDHTLTHTPWDRQAVVSSWRALALAENPVCRYEPLATLGESLALCRVSLSANRLARGSFDVGGYDKTEIHVIEVDAQGRRCWTAVFAADCLVDAIARLYERYADGVVDESERVRVATTARMIAAMPSSDVERWTDSLAADVELIDRRIAGIGSLRGHEAVMRSLRALFELGTDYGVRIDDVLGLRTDALCVRWTNSGTERAGGGRYERQFVLVLSFGKSGPLTRIEQFEADRHDAALARFDELASAPDGEPPRRRRVRPNSAATNAARLIAAINGRDVDAIPDLYADSAEIVHHPTGVTYDREGAIRSIRSLVDSPDMECRQDPLATLGDSLALCRTTTFQSASVGSDFDVGAVEREQITLIEVDAHGRRLRSEVFTTNHLGEAIARLYERYAEVLPDGPERARAAATARSVAVLPLSVLPGERDVERLATAFAPTIEWEYPGSAGFGSLRGSEAVLRGIRALEELSEDDAFRVDDILALRTDALLVRWTHFATDRTGGGEIEWQRIMLWLFGPDGLIPRWVQFDRDRDDEALARFDALTTPAPPAPRRVPANFGTAHADRMNTAVAARDAEAVRFLTSPGMQAVLHSTGAVLDRQKTLEWWRLFFEEDRQGVIRMEPVASLGDSLALCRTSWTGSASIGPSLDVGAYQNDTFLLVEGDSEGRVVRSEVFAPERLGNAITRLYERHAEGLPDGPEKSRAAATARSVAAFVSSAPSPKRIGQAVATNVEFKDHRRLVALPPLRGASEFRRRVESWYATVDDCNHSVDDIFVSRPDALLLRLREQGLDRSSGGRFESQRLHLFQFDVDGLVARDELFDPDCVSEALARFDELTNASDVPALRRVRANLATLNAARVNAAVAAGDVEAHTRLQSDDVQCVLHSTGVVLGPQESLAWWSLLYRDRDAVFRLEPIATLGDSLALSHQSWAGSASGDEVFESGAFERDAFVMTDVDAQARARRIESFAPDHLGDAITRLYERHAEGLPEGSARDRAAATACSVAVFASPAPSPERYGQLAAANVEFEDHRALVGLPPARGATEYRRRIESWFESVDDCTQTIDDVFELRPDALLARQREQGFDRSSGGRYEVQRLLLHLFDAHGLLARVELFDPDCVAEALERFDALTTASQAPIRRRVPANAATANAARVDAAVAARNADAFAELFSDTYETRDHRTSTTWGREGALLSLRWLLRAECPESHHEPFATLGDSLALFRWSTSASGFAGGSFDVGAYEREEITIFEVDERGRRRRGDLFPTHRLGDAVVRLYERHAELLPDGPKKSRAAATARSVAVFMSPVPPPERYGNAVAANVEFEDHRTLVGLPPCRGASEFRRRVESWFSTVDDSHQSIDDVFALRPDALLVRQREQGFDRSSGGRYELQRLLLCLFDVDGMLARDELFDPDCVAEALARLDELTTAAPPMPRFANAATRAMHEFERCWHARDFDGALATYHASHQLDDRRRFVRLAVSGEDFFANERLLFELSASRWRSELLATRGEQLALFRVHFTAEDAGSGPMEVEMLDLVEVDAAGRRVMLVVFDPNDADALDAAHAELDARYVTGEGARYAAVLSGSRAFAAAVAVRDWNALSSLLAADLVVYDHRPLGWETLNGPELLVNSWRALADLAPDVRLRVDHFVASAGGSLAVVTLFGSHEGGAFEDLRVIVHEYDENGRIKRHDIYSTDQLTDARERFAELAASAARDPRAGWIRPNAACAAMDRLQAVFDARDFAAARSIAAPGLRVEDRRHHSLISLDLEGWLADLERAAGSDDDFHYQRTLVATTGDRICLECVLFSGGPPDGRVEIEVLWLSEVDVDGRILAEIMFDLEDRSAAFDDALARFAAGEAAGVGGQTPIHAFGIASVRREWETLRGCLAEDLVMNDHRTLGLGVLRREEWIDALQALVTLAPDWNGEMTQILAWNRHGRVQVNRAFGTMPDGGGPFEHLSIGVFITARDLIRHVEIFEVADAARALARFDELCAEQR